MLISLVSGCATNEKVQSTNDQDSDSLCKNFYFDFVKRVDVVGIARKHKDIMDSKTMSNKVAAIEKKSGGVDKQIYIAVQKHPCFQYVLKHSYKKNSNLQKLPFLHGASMANALGLYSMIFVEELKVNNEEGIDFALFYSVAGIQQEMYKN